MKIVFKFETETVISLHSVWGFESIFVCYEQLIPGEETKNGRNKL